MDCPKLESIVVDGDNPVFDSRDNCNAIIDTQANTLLIGCKGTVIPSSVVSIGDDAFEGSGLTSIVIPDGGVVVTAEGSEIIVNGADSDAEVYGVSGALIYRGASHSVAVPAAGIYVVRVAGKAVKVAVTL